MGIETTGRLHTIFETKQVSERFSKREFVVEISDNPKYPQLVLFQLTGDRCSQLDGINVGEQVLIEFSLRGREWRSPGGEVKYFNSLDVWKIEPARAAASSSSSSGSGRRGGRGGGGGDPRDVGRDPRDGAPPPRDYEPRPRDLGEDNEDLPF